MFCPHLCRNLGLPHVIGVSRAVIYMSLVGPTSIYRELETCPAKLVTWIQPLHYGIAWCSFETVMHISETIHPVQVPQKVWALFQNELFPKKQDLWNLAMNFACFELQDCKIPICIVSIMCVFLFLSTHVYSLIIMSMCSMYGILIHWKHLLDWLMKWNLYYPTYGELWYHSKENVFNQLYFMRWDRDGKAGYVEWFISGKHAIMEVS